MDENEVLEALTEAGLEVEGTTTAWSASARLLSALDAIGRAGANALVKIDGGRSSDQVYTVVVSGGRLGEESFRKDGAELQPLLREAIRFYAAHARRH